MMTVVIEKKNGLRKGHERMLSARLGTLSETNKHNPTLQESTAYVASLANVTNIFK